MNPVLMPVPSTVPAFPWYITAMIGLACTTIVGFIIAAYRWMDAVKDNHLAHIQAATEKSAENTGKLATAFEVEATKAEARHDQVVQLFTLSK